MFGNVNVISLQMKSEPVFYGRSHLSSSMKLEIPTSLVELLMQRKQHQQMLICCDRLNSRGGGILGCTVLFKYTEKKVPKKINVY